MLGTSRFGWRGEELGFQKWHDPPSCLAHLRCVGATLGDVASWWLHARVESGTWCRYSGTSPVTRSLLKHRLGLHQNIRNGQGALPANTPMKEAMWDKYELKHRQRGFTWRTLPLKQYGNGPMMVHCWDAVFSGRQGDDAGGFLSIHANCGTKQWVSSSDKTGSILFQPRASKH